MEIILTTEAWLTAGLIFGLRVFDMTLNTLRFMLTLRGRKGWGWVLGFFQSIVFIIAITEVLQNLDNLLSIIGYAAGYATGTVLGVSIENKLAIGHTHIRVISPNLGAAVAEKLRAGGFAATEIKGRGRDGSVTLIIASGHRRDVKKMRDIIKEVDETAMVTAGDLRPIRRGHWHA